MIRRTTASTLKRIALFASLSPASLERVAAIIDRREVPSGSLIVVGDTLCEAVYFIESGEVRVYRVSPEGREQVLMRLGPGQAFNTASPFLPDQRTQANVAALSDAVLLRMRATGYVDLVTTCADLARALLGDFAGRLARLTDLVETLGLYSVQARLAMFLLEQAEERPSAMRNWTQDEIAAHLGTVRDVVGRCLRAFADEGLIQFGRGRIIVNDREGLRSKTGR